MSDCISITREKLELVRPDIKLYLGNCIEPRRRAISSFIQLGPPDFCVLTKEYKSGPFTIFSGQAPTYNYFHWALGVNVSSLNSVSEYHKRLVDNREGITLSGLRGAYHIAKFHFVSYNAIRKLDLNIEITSDNKSEVYTIDADGNKSLDVSEEFWQETNLCAQLRSLRPIPNLEPVTVYPVLSNLEQEKTFLELIASQFQKGIDLGNEDNSKPDSVNNYLGATVFNYFSVKNRMEQAREFFSKLAEKDDLQNAFVAKAKLQMGDIEEAAELAEKTARNHPNSIIPRIVQIQANFQKENPLQAKLTCEEALKTNPDSIELNYLYAEALAACKEYPEALRQMNLVPVQPKPVGDRYGNPQFTQFTDSSFELQCHDIKREDEAVFEREEASDSLLILDGTQLTDEERRAADLLFFLTREIGWENVFQEMKQFRKIPPKLSKIEPFAVVIEGGEASTPENKEEKKEENKEEIKDSKKEVEEITTEEIKSDEIQEQTIPGIPLSNLLQNAFHAVSRDWRLYSVWKETKDQAASMATYYSNDLVRLGMLCIRVGDLPEAERFLLRCTGSMYHIEAWKLLLSVFLFQGKIKETLLAADHVRKHYESVYPTTTEPFPLVTKAIYDLIASYGVSKVKAALSEITPTSTSVWNIANTGPTHAVINSTIVEATVWKSMGYDK
eukprot:TRINITY_DN117_c0_g1_i1.p1 TRINITY_DN117_c0_g1~~TRINITY_DN117_c0_g1_i1.p1  ORF type:complete len:672 (+),score=206.50 TRINITY_DN117_c0_g1_i1:66-2081(+)